MMTLSHHLWYSTGVTNRTLWGKQKSLEGIYPVHTYLPVHRIGRAPSTLPVLQHLRRKKLSPTSLVSAKSSGSADIRSQSGLAGDHCLPSPKHWVQIEDVTGKQPEEHRPCPTPCLGHIRSSARAQRTNSLLLIQAVIKTLSAGNPPES